LQFPILNASLNLAIAVVVSNYLGAIGKGEQGIIIATISIVVIITGIIGPGSLVFHFPRFPAGILIITSYVWLLVSSIGLYWVANFFELVPKQYILDVVILSIILSIISINISILVSKQKIKENNRVNNVQTIITFVILITLFALLSQPSIRHYLYAVYAGYIAALLISFRYTLEYYRFSEIASFELWKATFKSMFFLGVFNQLTIFTQMLSFRLSFYILDKYCGTSTVGIYSNGISIAESIWIISRSISMVLSSVVVNTVDREYTIKLTKILLWVNFGFSALCLIPLVLIPSDFYSYIFGKEFGEIVYIVRILAPGILVFGLVLIVYHYFSATGRHYYMAIASTVNMLVNIILSFLLIPRFSIYGAGIATSISFLITAIVVLYIFNRVTGGSFATILPKRNDLKILLQIVKEKYIEKT
jgi:O-antigen/teichoic acid export membrane protein